MKTTVKEFKDMLDKFPDNMEIYVYLAPMVGSLVAAKPCLVQAQFGPDYIIIGEK